jgi:transcriptional regulator with XRE-family HTH domain
MDDPKIPATGEPDSFGKRLEAALKARHILKMYALAVEMGVDESAISRWRRGRPISTGNLVKLCGTLDISIEWLLTGRGEMDRPADAAGPDWQTGFAREVAPLGRGNAIRLSRIFHSLGNACIAPLES